MRDPAKTDDDLADEILGMRHTCALDIADSREALMPSAVGVLMGCTGKRIDQLVQISGPRIKEELANVGYNFDLVFTDTHRATRPTTPRTEPAGARKVNAPPFPLDVRARAVSIYHRRSRADAAAFVELATGRKCGGALVRDWAKRSDKRKKKSGPWSSTRYPLGTVRKALALYRKGLAMGLSTRSAADTVVLGLGITLGYSTLLKWDKIAKDHGTP